MGMVVGMVRMAQSELEAYKADPERFVEDLEELQNSEEGRSLYLDKSWDGINWLLTGATLGAGDEPLRWAVYSEQFLDEEQDLGYGPASYVDAEQVQAVHAAMLPFTHEQFKARFIPSAMSAAGVYGIYSESSADEVEYFWGYFEQLRDFFGAAAEAGEGTISCIQ